MHMYVFVVGVYNYTPNYVHVPVAERSELIMVSSMGSGPGIGPSGVIMSIVLLTNSSTFSFESETVNTIAVQKKIILLC